VSAGAGLLTAARAETGAPVRTDRVLLRPFTVVVGFAEGLAAAVVLELNLDGLLCGLGEDVVVLATGARAVDPSGFLGGGIDMLCM
jgi:hypothetical protein